MAAIWGWIQQRRRQSRLWQEARRELRALLADPSRLQHTSLRSSQQGRADISQVFGQNGQLHAFEFTILRHPRPYAFSRQFHEVMELYRYQVDSDTLQRLRSLNMSRTKGRDGEPGSGF